MLEINPEILFYCTLAIIGLLLGYYVYSTQAAQSTRVKISRLTIRKCPSCKLVFVESRFNRKHRKSRCPRCSNEHTAKLAPKNDEADYL